MATDHVFKVFLILGVVLPYSSWCLPTVTNVNCQKESEISLGNIDEGYTGEVDILQGIPSGESLVLEAHLFPGVTFLKFNYTAGGSSAIISTSKPLDADTVGVGGLLYYAVKCSGTGLKNIRLLTILDRNDNPPIFQQPEYSATISETLGVGSSVVKVLAVDADATDANNRVTYSIQAPEPSVFEIRVDGLVQVKERLNYNTGSRYTFTVEAQDPGGLSDTATVTIEVTDFDNMNPYFDHSLYEATIPENQRGPLPSVLPAAIKAQDGDTGINQTVTYSITAVSPIKYQDSFTIDANIGIVSVTTPLDREEIASVTVQIKAVQQDDSFKTANAMVVVSIEDINDNPPKFDKADYSVAVLENSPGGSFVLQPKVTDEDLGGFIGTIRLIPDTVPFSVSQDGTITVKTSVGLDRETAPSFQFQVKAREEAAPNNIVTANVNISLLDVNDNSPQFGSAKYEGKVFINQTEGMLVVKVEASDPDEGVNGQVTYSIDGGNQDGYFAISADTGEVTLAKVIPLEENRFLRFSLYVTAKDGGDISRASSVVVDILAQDPRPHFLQRTYQARVEEERDAPMQILKVAFLSVAPGVPVMLQVETEADKFSIDNNGVLSTTAKLDYETKANYSVQLSLSDGTNLDQAVVEVEVLDVNDNSPVFAANPITVSISEDAEDGENVTVVTASDVDVGYNGEVRYSLQGGRGGFNVNPESGLISVATPLDREEQDQINFEVIAMDQGRPGRSATATVVITVTDVNDNKPVFSMAQYYITVSEVDEPGLLLANLTATDKDEGMNADVLYRIAKQDPPIGPPVFKLDVSTGGLTLEEKLDYGIAKRFILTVEAVDGGTPALTGNTMVTVQVDDVNNNPPEFSQERYDVAVPENVVGGAVLVSLEVTDKDTDGFSNGHFIMTSDTFNINKMGAISLNSNASLDREKQDSYTLQVVAVDQSMDGLSATAQVNITLMDINDNNPVFLPFPSTIAIPEGKYTVEAPGVMCQIRAEDKDAGENGRITISTSSYSETFSLKEDGTLVALAELDRETQDSYDLVIIATDHGKPQRQTVTNIRVTIIDVNDAPVFSTDTYIKNILSTESKGGNLVLTVKATDKDVGNNSVITYSFASGASENLSLNNETGDIMLTSDLSDVKEDRLLNLTAKAEDHGIPSLSSTATVLIYVLTVSLEGDVAFASPTYNFSLQENKPKGSVVGTVLASSVSHLFKVVYALKTHTDLFSVDTSGSILNRVELDMEAQEYYYISVEATDTRTPPSTALTVVMVQVENVNEMPVFDSNSYTAEIFSIAPFKYPIVKVKATDPDVGESERLRYSLAEPSSLFAVEPSSGQVYVVSAAGERWNVTLQVKAEDPHGLYATATVEVTIKDTPRSDIVVISLNQDIDTVVNKALEMKEALERALGWSVIIISYSSSREGLALSRTTEIKSLQRQDTPKTYVSFIATDTSGTNVIPKETVQRKLLDDEEKVLGELQPVFGPRVQFDVVDEDDSPNITTPIILGTVISLILIIIIIVGIIKRRKPKGSIRRCSDVSMDKMGNFQSSNLEAKSEGESKRG